MIILLFTLLLFYYINLINDFFKSNGNESNINKSISNDLIEYDNATIAPNDLPYNPIDLYHFIYLI